MTKKEWLLVGAIVLLALIVQNMAFKDCLEFGIC